MILVRNMWGLRRVLRKRGYVIVGEKVSRRISYHKEREQSALDSLWGYETRIRALEDREKELEAEIEGYRRVVGRLQERLLEVRP